MTQNPHETEPRSGSYRYQLGEDRFDVYGPNSLWPLASVPFRNDPDHAEARARLIVDALNAHHARLPIVIEVEGGCVVDVRNVPPSYEYQVVDHDLRDEGEEADGAPAKGGGQ